MRKMIFFGFATILLFFCIKLSFKEIFLIGGILWHVLII